MKKILLLLLLGITFSVANVGKITAVKGEVHIIRDNKQIVAQSGTILILKDKIQTQKKARALALFNDNTSITVGNSSTLSVNDFVMDLKTPSNSKTNFGFGKGLFRTITGKIGKINPKGFKIKTKSASIGIRGTTLDTSVKILPDGSEEVTVAFIKGYGTITSTLTGIETVVNTGQNANMQADGKTKLGTGPLKETTQINKTVKKEKKKKEKKKDEKKSSSESNSSDVPTVDTGSLVNTQNEETNNLASSNQATLDKKEEEKNNIVINNRPTILILHKNDPGSPSTTSISASDKNGDTLTWSIKTQPVNGTATIDSQTGEITYTRNAGYTGGETLTVRVSDGKSTVSSLVPFDTTATTTQIIGVTNLSDTDYYSVANDKVLDEVTKNLMCSTTPCNLYSKYVDYGYTGTISGGVYTKTGTYVNGRLTKESKIQEYIDSLITAEQTAQYTGGVAAFLSESGTTSNGTINLDMDFKNQSFTGDILIHTGNWKADITDGSIQTSGFSSTSIESASGSSISGISGSIDGKFLGPNAEAVGGTFNLNSTSNGTAIGSFGGKQ